MKVLRIAPLCLSVFVLVVELGAQQPSIIEGVSLIAGTEDVVGGAIVELRPNGSSGESLFAATQADGRFLFRDVPPGRYLLLSSRNGYMIAELGQKNPSSRGVPLVVGPGQQIAGLRLPMTPTASISGRIIDGAGQPMPGVAVQLLKPQFQDGRRTMTVMKSMLTNDLGEYRIFWVTPGSYYVNVLPPPDTPTGGGINLVMNPTGQAAGRSLWSNQSNVAVRPVGSGLPETQAYLPIFYPNTADENAAITVELQPGAEVRSIDIRVSPVRAFRVRGLVLNGSTRQPVAGANIQMMSIAPNSSRQFQTTSDSAGMFTIPRVPEGPYALAAIVNPLGIGRLIQIEVRNSDIDERVELQPFYSLAGRITAPTPAAFPIRLRLDYPIPGAPFMNTVPKPDDSFTLTNIPPGDYRVFVQPILQPQGSGAAPVPPALQSTYVKSIRFGGTDLLNGRLRLDRPPESPIEIVVATDPGSLGGRILNAAQTPAQGVTVALIPEAERRTFRGDLFKVTTADESGRYVFENIPPGDYRVFAWENVEDRAWQDPAFMQAHEERGKNVRISEGARQTLDLTSIP